MIQRHTYSRPLSVKVERPTLRPGERDCFLSIIIPLKDEQANITRLAGEIRTALVPMPYLWECLWVDDGSSDGTLTFTIRIQRTRPARVQELDTALLLQREVISGRNYPIPEVMAMRISKTE